MDSIALQPHPAARPDAIDSVEISIRRDEARLTLSFVVRGERLYLPPHVGFQRANDLWKTTCFELFLRQAGGGYLEFNFSPSGQWAAYAFDGYRCGMSDIGESPVVAIETGPEGLVAILDLESGSVPLSLGLSAVIEEASGTKSYWALAHPSDKPDFHHPDSFVLELP